LEALQADFHQQHKKQYTFQLEAPIEWVNFHLVASVPVPKPSFPERPQQETTQTPATYAESKVDFGRFGIHESKIYERDNLFTGTILNGPAIIAEKDTSTVLPPGFQLTIDRWGNLIIKKGNGYE
ncbi:MAG: hydantoinase/oxoprolinase family protein, partial [Bacteroidota bacterium]